ncbi:hypothetical protein M3Y99_01178300 [Aphelenchoides fujianensis]|nr:hypothetical protein M3Y99_01178300 [Aphelenchoides fujianensis]
MNGLLDAVQQNEAPTSSAAQLTDEFAQLPQSMLLLNERISQLNKVLQNKQEQLEATRNRLDTSVALHETIKTFNSEFNDGKEAGRNDESELLIAARSGDTPTVQQFLFEHSTSNRKDETGGQLADALFVAFQNGHSEVVRLLLAADGVASRVNLQEVCHYFSELRSDELVAKCRKCLQLIVNAVEAAEAGESP